MANTKTGDVLAVSEISVGLRRRQDNGDIGELAASIELCGLIHPIVVDEDGNLVAGGRRLEAVKLLGWKDVPVRRFGELSDDEKREIELEENVRRKDLTALERSRRIVEDAAKAREVLAGVRPKPPGPKGGRPAKPTSQRAVEKRTGLPRQTVQEAKAHVSFADRVPCSRPWEQVHCLQAKKVIESLPEKEQEDAYSLLGSIQVLDSGKLGVKYAENLVEMKPAERKELFALSQSDDSRERSLALTRLAKLPPPPDPRVVILHEVVHLLEKCRRMFPDDKANARFEPIVKDVKDLQKFMGGRG